MLILLYMLLTGGGLESAAMFDIVAAEARVANSVTEPERRAAVRKILGNMQKRVEKQDKAAQKSFKRVQAEVSKPLPDSDTIDSVLARQLEEQRAHNTRMIDLRFALRDELSRDEWEAMFPAKDEL